MGLLNFITGGASGLAGSVIGGVTGLLDSRAKRKQDNRNQRAKLLKAGIDERSNGLKDEFALVVVVAPALAVFFPSVAPHIAKGFEILKTMPDGYQYLLYGGLASALGLTAINKARK